MSKQKKNTEGYPHYPASEDIYNNAEHTGQGGAPDSKDPEDLAPLLNSDDIEESDADVTEDDLEILGDPLRDFELEDNSDIVRPEREEGDEDLDDLDVPGEELDDDLEEIGEEDEENNYYSLGGDRHGIDIDPEEEKY
ncbi:hypothetical protein MKQ68_21580 [Chitinophaga horti]|uniref:Uncharacterized protein n=1 Tax=Chitinophaga horti TaxID=2920382 RepID=A0ABY6IZ46_9BACT|nr:hypothetical protein [Chitinophaga horti]UYQ92674.1 hypothetical protein MKQ68_21580 [Chitinophaga horti]